jgi:uncharacterized cupin superfamily protein
MTEVRHTQVVNVSDVPPMNIARGQHRMALRRVGAAAKGATIGANHIELPPHSVSFPFHYHCATEEAIYILRGEGIARIGDKRVPVREGDWLAFPAGVEFPHQMVNETDEPLVYLCMSASFNKVDVVAYPDSGKVAGTAGGFERPIHQLIAREADALDYWDGEPLAHG